MKKQRMKIPPLYFGFYLCFFSLFLHFSAVALEKEAPTMPMESFTTILEPIRHALIMPLVNTRVVRLPFKLGDSFHKGDLLIEFDNRVFKANLLKASAILEKNQQDLKVKRALHKDDLASDLDLLEAEANVASAEADYVAALQSLEESEIRAPYDGKVAALGIHLFEIPTRDKPVMEIFEDKSLIANFLVPSRYLQFVRIGEPVYVHINDTHEIVEAKIMRISPNVNPASGTIKVEAVIDNSEGHLKSGMMSQAAFNREGFEKKEGSLGKIIQEIRKEEKQP